jgi:hypothetical protein
VIKKIPKSQASAGNVMLHLFGPILQHNLDQGTTVAAASYTVILKSKLKSAICKIMSKWVLLLHDKERPNSTAATVEATKNLVFKLLPRSPLLYISDQAPTDYSMFGYLPPPQKKP